MDLLHGLIHPMRFDGSILPYLQGMYGPETTWRSLQQYQGVFELFQLQRDVILALGCNSGKTAIAVLPSLVENGITVIVIPLLSLLADWKRRLGQLGIPFLHFHRKAPVTNLGSINLILATSDAIRTRAWDQYIIALTQQKPLLRMIFDEAHSYFTDLIFRAGAMADPYMVRTIPFQVVLCTGSLPPLITPFLSQQFALESPAVIRSSAVSPWIVFMRHKPLSGISKKGEAILSYIHGWEGRYGSKEDRYIVFVQYKKDGEALVKLFDSHGIRAHFYQASRKSKDQKEGPEHFAMMLEDWIKGLSSSIIIATNALSAGFDSDQVRMVFFVNMSSDFVTFYQQSHRAGRDNFIGFSILLPNTSLSELKEPDTDHGDLDRMRGVPDMREYSSFQRQHNYDPSNCLRYRISSFLDEVGQTCAEICEKGFCYFCGHCFQCKKYFPMI